jgi:predicted AlkP superfamily pyrophosphatase or phosphodiesterase
MGWEQMRDISRPGSFQRSFYININTIPNCDDTLTNKAIEDAKSANPDFIYLYLGDTDEIGGHRYGWMSKEYLSFVNTALSNVKKVVEALGEEYTIIVTADHGGHDRCHGTDMAEDMTIPMFFIGENFEKAKEIENVSILDITPTIASIMGVPFAPEWEGKVLTNK